MNPQSRRLRIYGVFGTAFAAACSPWVKKYLKVLHRGHTFRAKIRTASEGAPDAWGSAMTRQELVLAMLACADGRRYTPAQIQKAIFLVCRNVPHVISRGPGFEFEPYDYGPFDSSVYSEIQALATTGDALIEPSGVGRWDTYAASDLGLERGRELLAGAPPSVSEYLVKTSQWVRSQSFSGLVKSIYEAYPEMRRNSIFRG
jgi:hypothetical protein